MILDRITSFISKFISLVSKKSPFTKGGQGGLIEGMIHNTILEFFSLRLQ